MAAAAVDQLVVGRVIGDVVDMFVPTVNIKIDYGPGPDRMSVVNGCHITPSKASIPPTVNIAGDPHQFFTLVMTDPDAPSPDQPSNREWLHWMVKDIPGGSDPSQGKEVVGYMGPSPPVGIHRYIFVLFQQKSPLGDVKEPMSRAKFNTRAFAHELGLGLPVAAFYFNSDKESSTSSF